MPSRRPWKFESVSGNIVYKFPLAELEWSTEQELSNSLSLVVGADYAYDNLGIASGKKAPATETVRAVLMRKTPVLAEEAIDEMRSNMFLAGRGKLWITAQETDRWAWARLQRMPSITLGKINTRGVPFIAEFLRLSDWFARSQITQVEPVAISGHTFTVNNPGTLPVKLLTIRLRANAAAGIINPKITNLNTFSVFETTRDSASAASEIKLDTSGPSILYSNDDGGTFIDDFVNYVQPALQLPGTFVLQPGDNTISYEGGGTPNLNIEFIFYPVFM